MRERDPRHKEQEKCSFKRSGATHSAPLQFLTGHAHGCRSKYSSQSSHWPVVSGSVKDYAQIGLQALV